MGIEQVANNTPHKSLTLIIDPASGCRDRGG